MSSPRLLDQVRDRLRVKHYSMRTEDTYFKVPSPACGGRSYGFCQAVFKCL